VVIKSKAGQRLMGVFLIALGAGGTIWVWHTALTEGYYQLIAAPIFPAFLVFGLGALLFPIDVEKLKAEHGVEKIENFRQFPPVWRGVMVAALVAGFGNWFALALLG
jgi:hypothetical protein